MLRPSRLSQASEITRHSTDTIAARREPGKFAIGRQSEVGVHTYPIRAHLMRQKQAGAGTAVRRGSRLSGHDVAARPVRKLCSAADVVVVYGKRSVAGEGIGLSSFRFSDDYCGLSARRGGGVVVTHPGEPILYLQFP